MLFGAVKKDTYYQLLETTKVIIIWLPSCYFVSQIHTYIFFMSTIERPLKWKNHEKIYGMLYVAKLTEQCQQEMVLTTCTMLC